MWILHINRQAIEECLAADGRASPPINCIRWDGRSTVQEHAAFEVVIYGQDGKEAARLVTIPTREQRRAVGMHRAAGIVWIQTDNDIEVIS